MAQVPKSAVEKAIKTIRKYYTDTADIYTMQQTEENNIVTGEKWVQTVEGKPCRLSFQSSYPTDHDTQAASLRQEIELFIDPDISIPPTVSGPRS